MFFCNGKYIPATEPVLSLNDRGFLFGDGVFTTLRVVEGRIEFYDAHKERFYAHCKALAINPPAIDFEVICKLITYNEATRGIWRLKIIATAKCRHDSPSLRPVGTFAILLEKEIAEPKESLRLKTYDYPIAGPHLALKTLACLPRFALLDEALHHNYDDGVALSPEGFITETSFANLFWRMEDTLFSPSPKLPLLSGITLGTVKAIAKMRGWNWRDVRVTPNEIPDTAQLYICNSMKGIIPVIEYDDKRLNRDLNFEEELLKLYRAICHKNSFALPI